MQFHRRCWHMDEKGQQCEVWFPAEDDNKLCALHRNGASPSQRNGETEDQKLKYIDLVNDERSYCYHFKDGSAQNQSQSLISEFKDDTEGSVFDKLDRHIAFLETVISDLKARHQTARAVRAEKLDKLSEDERKELRKIRIEKPEPKVKAVISEAKTSAWKDKLSKVGASLDMDMDAMLAKFESMKQKRKE